MRISSSLPTITLLLTITLITLFPETSESKKPPPRVQHQQQQQLNPPTERLKQPPILPTPQHRPPPHHPGGRNKKVSLLPNLFRSKKHGRNRRRNRRPPPPPPHHPRDMMTVDESRRVYYYDLERPTQRPRIILGEELDFSELGIQNTKKPVKHQESSKIPPPPTSLHLNDDYYYDEFPSIQQQHQNIAPIAPPRDNRLIASNSKRIPKKHRGPGYRIRDQGSWEDHYILEHQRPLGSNNKRRPGSSGGPKVMDSMMRAAGELRNAYKAAVIQSAKVAKFTSHTAGKYFKGVRNIFSGTSNSPGGSNNAYRKVGVSNSKEEEAPLRIDEVKVKGETKALIKESEDIEEGDAAAATAAAGLPQVHLDWGSSFWKMFYNKPKRLVNRGDDDDGVGVMMMMSLSEIERRNDGGGGEKNVLL